MSQDVSGVVGLNSCVSVMFSESSLPRDPFSGQHSFELKLTSQVRSRKGPGPFHILVLSDVHIPDLAKHIGL